jgi:hypothetical protein
MSDYLYKLAARALRRQEPVRPRLASIFEPITAAPSTVRPTTSSAEPYDQPRLPAHETIAPPHAAPLPRAVEQESGQEPRDQSPAAPAAPREPEQTEEKEQQFTPTEGTRGPAHAQHTQRETPRRVEVINPETRFAVAADMSSRERNASESMQERAPEIEGGVASLEARHADESARRETIRPIKDAVVPVDVRPAAQPSVLSVPTHTAAARGRGLEQRAEPPRISVTIGRVDVRAVFPARTEAPRAPHTGPTNSLAAYLKQREGGRR